MTLVYSTSFDSYRLLLSATYLLMYINLPGKKHAVFPGVWMLIMEHIVLLYTPSFSLGIFLALLTETSQDSCWFFLSSIFLFVVDRTILFLSQESVNINVLINNFFIASLK